MPDPTIEDYRRVCGAVTSRNPIRWTSDELLVARRYLGSRRLDEYRRTRVMRPVAAFGGELALLGDEGTPFREKVVQFLVELDQPQGEAQTDPPLVIATGADSDRTPYPPLPRSQAVRTDGPDDLCGIVVDGRYLLVEVHDSGGMGVVYRGTDLRLGRAVAVKVLSRVLAGLPELTDRFRREALLGARLDHPYITPVYDTGVLGELGGRPYLVMRFVTGQTLAEAASARPGEDVDTRLVRVLRYFLALCDAIEYAHAQGVQHCDLKPVNVMVGDGEAVQVLDWGLGRERRAGGRGRGFSSEEAGETRVEGARNGTPAYMPPEQANGGAVDHRTDVFGLGGVLVFLLTGEAVYTGGGTDAVLGMASRGDTEPALRRVAHSGNPAELGELASRCLTREPGDRPASARAVADAVTAYQAGVAARLIQTEAAQAATAAREEEEKKTRLEAEARARAEGAARSAAEARLGAEAAARVEAEARGDEQRKRRRAERVGAAILIVACIATGAAGWAYQSQQANVRAQDEVSRVQRQNNRDALAQLITQCQGGLRGEDAERVGELFAEAERRQLGGGGEDLRAQFDRCRADLALLKELDRIDEVRWGVQEDVVGMIEVMFRERRRIDGIRLAGAKRDLAGLNRLVGRWRAAFSQYGVVPGRTPPDVAAEQINGSLIRDRLLATLALWLAAEPAGGDAINLVAILRSADPDPFRGAVWEALRAGNVREVRDRVGAPEMQEQPAWFAVVVAQHFGVPNEQRQKLFRGVLASRPAYVPALMSLATSGSLGVEEEIGLYRAVLAARPKNVAAWCNLGTVLADRRDFEGAIKCFREAIRLDPEFAAAHNNLGLALLRTADVDGAIKQLREAIRLDPALAAAHGNLITTLVHKGDVNEAVAAGKEAIRFNPSSALAHNNLANGLLAAGDLAGAVTAYREAIRLDPAFATAWTNLGIAFIRKNDLDAAVAAYKEAIRVDRTYAPAYYNLGKALIRQKDAGRAETSYREAIRLDPNFALAYYDLGTLLLRKPDWDGAIVAFRAAIRSDPGYAQSHNNLGNALYRKGNIDEAIGCYREAIGLDSKLFQAHNGLGTALLDKRDAAGAVKCFETALDLAPDNQVIKANLEKARRLQTQLNLPIAPPPREIQR